MNSGAELGDLFVMKLFMEPRSIALVGVSRRTGGGTNVLENLLHYGYPGKLYPVNPNTSEILGVKTYPTVKDIPVEIDLAIIYAPRLLVPQLIKQCTEKGIKAIAVVAQGFTDADEEGHALQREMSRIALEGGARILGPNSFGVANGFLNLNTAFVPFDIDRIPIATIAQSGILFAGGPRVKFLGKGIDLGNACDIGFEEALQYFGADPDIKVLALYLESIRDGKRFLRIAKQVSTRKPVIALKGGRTRQGATAVLSHTGSIAGKDEIYAAAFHKSGVILAEDFDELEDLVTTFWLLPLSTVNKLGIITVPMAGGVMATDACVRQGLQLAFLSPQTRRRIARHLPPWLGVGNPVDIGIASFTEIGASGLFQEAAEALLSDPQVDALLLIIPSIYFYPKTLDLISTLAEAVRGYPDKPVVTWLYVPDERVAAEFKGRGLVLYPTIERAIRALSHLSNYSEFRKRATG